MIPPTTIRTAWSSFPLRCSLALPARARRVMHKCAHRQAVAQTAERVREHGRRTRRRRRKKGNKDGQRSKAVERYPVTQLRREGQRSAATRPSSYLKFTLPAPLLISTLTPLIKGSCIGAITMKWVKEGVCRLSGFLDVM